MSMKELRESLEVLGGRIRADAREPVEIVYYSGGAPSKDSLRGRRPVDIVSGTVIPRCQVRQYSDMMSCSACGLAWDTNDPDPPRCPRP